MAENCSCSRMGRFCRTIDPKCRTCCWPGGIEGKHTTRHRLRTARKAPGRNEAGDGLRGPKPDPAYPYGCEPFAEVSSLARCLTIRLLSNHSADIANS